jgi:Xaa-Pro aminopeptidase
MSAATGVPPFDSAKLDALMDEAGVDLMLASSRHNVRYLLGDYSTFFAHFDAIGVERYLPLLGYVRARPDLAFLVDSALDRWYHEHSPTWIPNVRHGGVSATRAIDAARTLASELGLRPATIAVEPWFLPEAAARSLATAFAPAAFVDGSALLEELRAVKRPDELALLRTGSERVVDAMAATVQSVGRAATTREIVGRLHAEEIERGLDFEYCLIAAGASHNRDASDAVWAPGSVLSLDSGGCLEGYIADLCRMAVHDAPTQEQQELHAEVLAMQVAAESAVRAGTTGEEVYARAAEVQATLPHRDVITFVAHGVGLISHEAPRFTDAGPIPYAATHRHRPLEAGMVLSIETELRHETCGFIKLEDTLAVSEGGCERYGEHREWMMAG